MTPNPNPPEWRAESVRLRRLAIELRSAGAATNEDFVRSYKLDDKAETLFECAAELEALSGGGGDAVELAHRAYWNFNNMDDAKMDRDAMQAALAAAYPALVADKARIDWLEANEASLVMHAETWNVEDPECE